MTLRIEYQGVILANVKVPESVTASVKDKTVHMIGKAALGRIDTRVLDWSAHVIISISRNDSAAACEVNVSDFLDINGE